MAAGRSLIDPHRQSAHLRHTVGNFLAEQHPAAARLCALPDHHFDSIRLAQIVGVHPVSAGQILIDQMLRLPALFGRHPAIAGRRAGARDGRPAPQRLFGLPRKRAKAHPCNRDRDLQVQRLFGKARAQPHIGRTFFAVSLQRIARNRSPQKQQIVEMRQSTLGSAAANVINAGGRSPPDFRQSVRIKSCRITRQCARSAIVVHQECPQYAEALST